MVGKSTIGCSLMEICDGKHHEFGKGKVFGLEYSEVKTFYRKVFISAVLRTFYQYFLLPYVSLPP